MEPLLTKMTRHLNLKRVAIAGVCSIVLDFAVTYILVSSFFYLEDSTAQAVLFWMAAIISWPVFVLMVVSPPGSLEMALPFGVIGTALFWGLVFEVVYSRIARKRSNNALE